MQQPPLTRALLHRRATLLLTVAAAVSAAAYGCDGDRVQSPLIPQVKAMRPRATYVKESGVIDLPVPAQSYPGDGGTEWTPSGVIIPAGNKFIRWHLTVPSITYNPQCGSFSATVPEGPLNPGGYGGPMRYGATLVDFTYPSFPADSHTIGFSVDPAGGYTAIQENGGGFMPTAKRASIGSRCIVIDTTRIDPVTGAYMELLFPAYNFSGSHRLEFETIDAGISLSPSPSIFVGDSIEFSLFLEDPKVPIDSIRWQFLYWPKKSLPAIPAPGCNDQRNCIFKPTASGGRAWATVYTFANNITVSSQEISAFNRCASDPPLADDILLQSPTVRAALVQLLDSAWADSAAGKRRERQIYFYRSATDASIPPTVFVTWNDSVTRAPTPCQSFVRRKNPGPDFVLMGYGHSHPFTPGEIQPPECGPPWAGNPYTQGPSTFDNAGQAKLSVPGYAIDKESINKYGRKPKYINKLYDWNTSSCKW